MFHVPGWFGGVHVTEPGTYVVCDGRNVQVDEACGLTQYWYSGVFGHVASAVKVTPVPAWKVVPLAGAVILVAGQVETLSASAIEIVAEIVGVSIVPLVRTSA